MAAARTDPLSKRLLKQQVSYFRKLQRAPDDDVRARVLHTQNGLRRRGRPRLEWLAEVSKCASVVF